jgi:hypothetical protein
MAVSAVPLIFASKHLLALTKGVTVDLPFSFALIHNQCKLPFLPLDV